MKTNKGGTVIEVLVALVIILVVVGGLIGILFALIGGGVPNSGQHTGIVTSVEQEGIIWHTYKAYVKTSAQSTQEDAYCVTDPQVVTALQNDADAIKEVTVYYSRGFFVGPWSCGGESSIIRSVK